MFLGIDASTQKEVDAKSPHYYYEGKEIDPWSFLHDHNHAESMRLRLWVDPYDEKGKPYGGGTNDYETFVTLSKRALNDGYRILLDIHYSDFWCDPGKQFLPKSWRGHSLSETCSLVYEYTKKTLLDLKKEGIEISYIQIGNEITNGMLWPLGKLGEKGRDGVRTGYDNLSLLLKSGIKAAKEIIPSAKLILHLERSGDKQTHEEFFREMEKRDVIFDIIGLSYYPYWHGTFDMVFANIDNLKAKFNHPIWIVETGYGFTTKPSILNGNYDDYLISEHFFQQTGVYRPFPLTKEGQCTFIRALIKEGQKHQVEAIYYWEPFWLSLPGLEWASKEGEAYTGETNKPTHNEWANQCLFDYEGNATPALDAFKIEK